MSKYNRISVLKDDIRRTNEFHNTIVKVSTIRNILSYDAAYSVKVTK